MLRRKVRTLAVLAVTIVSATMLVALGTPRASASTGDLCHTGDNPWDCLQVFGTGLQVDGYDGWAYNNSGASEGGFHIEFYTAPSDEFPNGSAVTALVNSPGFSLPPYSNSQNYDYAADITSAHSYWVCDALWQATGSGYNDIGHVCGHVVP
jgi:hypothetical protein